VEAKIFKELARALEPVTFEHAKELLRAVASDEAAHREAQQQ
jgi:hypothetical protein